MTHQFDFYVRRVSATKDVLETPRCPAYPVSGRTPSWGAAHLRSAQIMRADSRLTARTGGLVFKTSEVARERRLGGSIPLLYRSTSKAGGVQRPERTFTSKPAPMLGAQKNAVASDQADGTGHAYPSRRRWSSRGPAPSRGRPSSRLCPCACRRPCCRRKGSEATCQSWACPSRRPDPSPSSPRSR
jgi:hypothetical protein